MQLCRCRRVPASPQMQRWRVAFHKKNEGLSITNEHLHLADCHKIRQKKKTTTVYSLARSPYPYALELTGSCLHGYESLPRSISPETRVWEKSTCLMLRQSSMTSISPNLNAKGGTSRQTVSTSEKLSPFGNSRWLRKNFPNIAESLSKVQR